MQRQRQSLVVPALLCCAVASYVLPATAQSVTVISSGEDARHCSVAAKLNGTRIPSSSELGACDRAIDDLRLSRQDRAGTLVNRGILRTAAGQYQGALDDYNLALSLVAALPQAYNGKGNLYFLAERYDDALAAYQQALALDLEERHIAYYNLGLTFDKLQDPAAATRSYQAALTAAPDWPLPKQKLDARATPTR